MGVIFQIPESISPKTLEGSHTELDPVHVEGRTPFFSVIVKGACLHECHSAEEEGIQERQTGDGGVWGLPASIP